MAAVNFRTDWEEEMPMCRCSVICSMMLMGMSMRSTSGEACLVMQTQEKISHTSMMNSLEELPLRRSLAQPTFLPILDGSGSDRHHSPITVFVAGISGCQTSILQFFPNLIQDLSSQHLWQGSTDFRILLAIISSFAMIFAEEEIQMIDRAMSLLQSRVDEIREMLQYIDGPTARQMEQEMDRIQKIIDAFRTNNADSDS